MEREFRAIATKTFTKSGKEIVDGKVYKLSELENVLGNSTIIKYFREITSEVQKEVRVITITKRVGKKGKVMTFKKVETTLIE